MNPDKIMDKNRDAPASSESEASANEYGEVNEGDDAQHLPTGISK
jgi:hypothetical protein